MQVHDDRHSSPRWSTDIGVKQGGGAWYGANSLGSLRIGRTFNLRPTTVGDRQVQVGIQDKAAAHEEGKRPARVSTPRETCRRMDAAPDGARSQSPEETEA